MKKTFLAATAAIVAGAAMMMCAAPASAHERIGFDVAIGVPAPYVVPAPVVYGGYGPVVTVGAPYYYHRDWRYYHGFRGEHEGFREHDGFRGDRGGFHGGRR